VLVGYFRAKGDLEFMHGFMFTVTRYWTAEQIVNDQIQDINDNQSWDTDKQRDERETVLMREGQKFDDLRVRVAKDTNRAARIARRYGASVDIASYPAPLIGGPIIQTNIFQCILRDVTHGNQVTPQIVVDAINQTIGACEEQIEIEWRHLKNPLYWIKAALIFVLRIPFMIIEATGFDVSKVEDHFLAKLFKLIEVIIIFYVLIRLGAGKEALVDFFKGLVK